MAQASKSVTTYKVKATVYSFTRHPLNLCSQTLRRIPPVETKLFAGLSGAADSTPTLTDACTVPYHIRARSWSYPHTKQVHYRWITIACASHFPPCSLINNLLILLFLEAGGDFWINPLHSFKGIQRVYVCDFL